VMIRYTNLTIHALATTFPVPFSRAQNDLNELIASNFDFRHVRVISFMAATCDKFLRLLRHQRLFFSESGSSGTAKTTEMQLFHALAHTPSRGGPKEIMFGGTLLRARKVPSGVPTIKFERSDRTGTSALIMHSYICTLFHADESA
jgi:hypothetical protein